MDIYSSRLDHVIEEIIKPNLKLISDLKVSGMTDKNIAKALGISVKEFLQCKEICEIFKDTYEDAMEILTSQLTNIVVQRALGTDGRMDAKGELLPPDEKLAFKLLEKFDGRFKQTSEVTSTFRIENLIKTIAREQEEEIVIE